MTRRGAATHVLVALALAAAVLVLFGRVGHYPFNPVDDSEYVIENERVHRGLTLSNVAWAFTTFDNANWHPLTWISYMADVSLFGVNPGGHHLVNLLFHLVGTLLLFDMFRRMTRRTWESGLVAALFAVHPLHVESVAWIAERKDVLSTVFWFLTMRAYHRYVESPGPWRYAATVASFALGLLAKPMLVTLPFCLLLLDHWPLGRFPAVPLRRLVAEKLPLFVLSAAASAVTVAAQGDAAAIGSLTHFPLWARIGNAAVSYGDYLSKALVPVGLAVFYPHPMASLSIAKAVVSGFVLLVVTGAAIREFRRRGWFAVGWFWYLGTLVPVIGLVQVGTQGMADRYTYVPLVGFFVILAWGGREIVDRARIPAPAVAAVAASWLLALSACAWNQLTYWRGVVPLFTRALEVTRENAFAHTILGAAAYEAGDDAEATRQLGEALRIHPEFPDAHLNLGLVLERQGRFAEAESHMREAVRLFPDDAKANYNLWLLLRKMGRTGEAARQLAASGARGEKGAAEHNSAGRQLAQLGSFEEAAEQFREALRLNPEEPDAAYNLGLAYVKLGKDEAALEPLERAVAQDPRDKAARFTLAALYYRLGRIGDSVRQYETLLEQDPADETVRARLRRIREARG